MVTLLVISLDFYIFLTFKFCPISSVRKVFKGQFSLSSRKKNWSKACITPPKTEIFQFDLFELVTSKTLTWNMFAEGLAWQLYRSITGTSYAFLYFFYLIHTALVRCTAKHDKSWNMFALTWPVTSSVTPRSRTLDFPGQVFHVYRVPFEICSSVQ